MVERTVTLEEAYCFSDEIITGANSLAQQGYGSYNPWIHEEHRVSVNVPAHTRNPIKNFYVTFGRALSEGEVVEIDGRRYASPFWSMFDLWYSQTDDSVLTEALEDFEVEGILDDFLEFCKVNGMSESVYDFNVRKYIECEELVDVPSVLNYPLYREWDVFG